VTTRTPRILVVDNYDSFVFTIVGYLQQLGAECEVVRATVGRAPELRHGKTSLVHHDASGVLDGLATPFRATRYHSLTIDPATRPDTLLVNGHTDTGIIMAVRHAELPLHGVQFHPESVLTEGGHRLLANWLALCGMTDAVQRSAGLSPLVHGLAVPVA
jgi:para-aminobenzoate synthetase component 2